MDELDVKLMKAGKVAVGLIAALIGAELVAVGANAAIADVCAVVRGYKGWRHPAPPVKKHWWSK